jgi:phosphatidate cytidylyltransferase
MLRERILSAIVLIPIVAAAVYFGGLFFLVIVLVTGLLAGYEFLLLARHDEARPPMLLGLLLIALLIADGQWPQAGILRPTLLIFSLALLTAQIFRGNAAGSLHSWALTLTGGLYVGLALSFFPRLRSLDLGIYWLIIALLGTWTCDSGAYFVGRAYGRQPFFPKISPKKTLEGAVGGLVSGVALVAPLARWLLGLGWGWGILLGIVLVFGATFGDLSESVIKRQVGVKDSSGLIPGHGGMLDRIDSLLFVVPLVYYMSVVIHALS